MSRFETFAYLPPLSPAQAQAQINGLLNTGCVPVIEFSENPTNEQVYWQEWPLVTPRANQQRAKAEDLNASLVMMQVDACARRHPFAYIKFSAYSTQKQQFTSSFIVKVPDAN